MNSFLRVLYVATLADFAEEVKPEGTIVRVLVTDDHNVRSGTVTSTLTVQGDSRFEPSLVCLRYSVTSLGAEPHTRAGQMLIVAKLVRDYLSALGYTVRDGQYALLVDFTAPEGTLECVKWRRRERGNWYVEPSDAYRRVVGVAQ